MNFIGFGNKNTSAKIDVGLVTYTRMAHARTYVTIAQAPLRMHPDAPITAAGHTAGMRWEKPSDTLVLETQTLNIHHVL